MTKLMGMANICIWKELPIKATVIKTNRTDKEESNGLMELSMKENTQMGRKTDLGIFIGQMDHPSEEDFSITTLKAKEPMFGQMEDHTKANG